VPLIVIPEERGERRNMFLELLRIIDGISQGLLSEGKRPFVQCLDGTARSFGQVVFCNNPFSGIVILIAMMIGDLTAGFCALLCTFMVNGIATWSGIDKGLIRHGLLGYNAVLVGSGIATFLKFEHPFLPFIVSAIAAPIILFVHLSLARVLSQFGSAALTLPFNFVMMSILLSSESWRLTSRRISTIGTTNDSDFIFYDAAFKGISEIFIIDNAHSGILIFIGMTISSRILAVGALVGSILGSLGSWIFLSTATEVINNGLSGYNCALTVPALCFFLVPSWKVTPILCLYGAVITLGIESMLSTFLSSWAIPYMTLPFCLATLPFLTLDTEALFFGSNISFLRIIDLADLTTPSEHYTRFRFPNKK